MAESKQKQKDRERLAQLRADIVRSGAVVVIVADDRDRPARIRGRGREHDREQLQVQRRALQGWRRVGLLGSTLGLQDRRAGGTEDVPLENLLDLFAVDRRGGRGGGDARGRLGRAAADHHLSADDGRGSAREEHRAQHDDQPVDRPEVFA